MHRAFLKVEPHPEARGTGTGEEIDVVCTGGSILAWLAEAFVNVHFTVTT